MQYSLGNLHIVSNLEDSPRNWTGCSKPSTFYLRQTYSRFIQKLIGLAPHLNVCIFRWWGHHSCFNIDWVESANPALVWCNLQLNQSLLYGTKTQKEQWNFMSNSSSQTLEFTLSNKFTELHTKKLICLSFSHQNSVSYGNNSKFRKHHKKN